MSDFYDKFVADNLRDDDPVAPQSPTGAIPTPESPSGPDAYDQFVADVSDDIEVPWIQTKPRLERAIDAGLSQMPLPIRAGVKAVTGVRPTSEIYGGKDLKSRAQKAFLPESLQGIEVEAPTIETVKQMVRSPFWLGKGFMDIAGYDPNKPAAIPTESDNVWDQIQDMAVRGADAFADINYKALEKITESPNLKSDLGYALRREEKNKAENYLSNVVGLAPQIQAQALAHLQGGKLLSGAMMFVNIAGNSYEENLSNGASPKEAMAAALANAGIQAPMEALSFGWMLRAPGIGSGIKRFIASRILGAFTEGVTETLQGAPEEVTGTLAMPDERKKFLEADVRTQAKMLADMAWEGVKKATPEGLAAAPYGLLLGGADAKPESAKTEKRVGKFRKAYDMLTGKRDETGDLQRVTSPNEAAEILDRGIKEAAAEQGAIPEPGGPPPLPATEPPPLPVTEPIIPIEDIELGPLRTPDERQGYIRGVEGEQQTEAEARQAEIDRTMGEETVITEPPPAIEEPIVSAEMTPQEEAQAVIDATPADVEQVPADRAKRAARERQKEIDKQAKKKEAPQETREEIIESLLGEGKSRLEAEEIANTIIAREGKTEKAKKPTAPKAKEKISPPGKRNFFQFPDGTTIMGATSGEIYNKATPEQRKMMEEGKAREGFVNAFGKKVFRNATTVSAKGPKKVTTAKQLHEAAAETDPNPSYKEIKDGTYRKGEVEIQGLPISIENAKGSTRKENVPPGKKPSWRVRMKAVYGFFKTGRKAKDGEGVDVFVGDDVTSENVYIIDQANEDGTFDEPKVMLGYKTRKQAQMAYRAHYPKGFDFTQMRVTKKSMPEFKEWLQKGDPKKPQAVEETVKPPVRKTLANIKEHYIKMSQRWPEDMQLTEDDFDLIKPENVNNGEAIVSFMKTVFGFENVVFFETDNAFLNNTNGNTIRMRDIDRENGFIFINTRNETPGLQVAGHEMGHEIEKTMPKKYKVLKALMWRMRNEGDYTRFRNRKLPFYTRQLAAKKGIPADELNPADIEDAVFDEYVQEFLGSSLFDEKFLGEVMKEDQTLFEKIVGMVSEVIKKMGDAILAQPNKFDRVYFDDLATAQKLMATMVRQYNQYRAGEYTAGMGEFDVYAREVLDRIRAPKPEADLMDSPLAQNIGAAGLPVGAAGNPQILFDVKERGWDVDFEQEEFGVVNNRLSKELEAFEVLFGPTMKAVEVPGKYVKNKRELTRSITTYDLLDEIYRVIDDGQVATLLDKTKTIEEIADSKGLKGKERKRFLDHLHSLRNGKMYDIESKTQTLGNNGKAGMSADFLLATCHPTTPCKECYAAAAMIRMSAVKKALRSTIHVLTDPKGWAKIVAAEVMKKKKTELPFVRMLGSGDLITDEQVEGMNELAKLLDRPIHIFSRHHDMLKKLKSQPNAPFIKMGSIDADLYKFYGPKKLAENMKKHGIANAWLMTDASEIKAIEALNKKGALQLVLAADTKLHDQLPAELRKTGCPCDSGERTYFYSCKQCALSESGCFMAFSEYGIDKDGKPWKIMDPKAPTDLTPITAFVEGKEKSKSLGEVYIGRLQKSIDLIRLNIRKFLEAEFIRENFDPNKKTLPPYGKQKKGKPMPEKKPAQPKIAIKNLHYPDDVKYVDNVDAANSYIGNLLGMIEDARKFQSSLLPGGEIQNEIRYEEGKKIDVEPDFDVITDPERIPKKTVKAYKLFTQKDGELYPLFVKANETVPMGKWLAADVGPMVGGKVKSKIGQLAFRPGWHSGDMPVATHIGGKSDNRLKKPNYRPDNQVWAEVEVSNDVNWQKEANKRASVTKQGKIIPRTAQISDQVPEGGHYRYKTNPNMTGEWLISGEIKVNRILTDEEVKEINGKLGVADLPRKDEAVVEFNAIELGDTIEITKAQADEIETFYDSQIEDGAISVTKKGSKYLLSGELDNLAQYIADDYHPEYGIETVSKPLMRSMRSLGKKIEKAAKAPQAEERPVVEDLITKPLRDFAADLNEKIRDGANEMREKVDAYDGWQFEAGQKVKSKQTGKMYRITGRLWDMRNDRPQYFYESLDGDEKGTFIGERAHENMIPVAGPIGVAPMPEFDFMPEDATVIEREAIAQELYHPVKTAIDNKFGFTDRATDTWEAAQDDLQDFIDDGTTESDLLDSIIDDAVDGYKTFSEFVDSRLEDIAPMTWDATREDRREIADKAERLIIKTINREILNPEQRDGAYDTAMDELNDFIYDDNTDLSTLDAIMKDSGYDSFKEFVDETWFDMNTVDDVPIIPGFDTMEPITQDAKEVIDAKIGRTDQPLRERTAKAWNSFWKNKATLVVDKFAPVKKHFGEGVEYMMHRGIPGAPTSMLGQLLHGKLKWNAAGDVLTVDTKGEGFIPWVKGLKKDGEKFFYWLVVKRAEALEKEGREKLLGKSDRDKIMAWVGDPKGNKSWDELNKEFQAFNDAILDIAQEAGLIDPASRKLFQQEFYIPFYRVFEDEETAIEFVKSPKQGSKFLSAQIKRLKGSEKKIGDPFENIMKNWNHLVVESIKNKSRGDAFRTAERLALPSGYYGLDEDGNEVEKPLVEEVQWKDTVRFKGVGKATFIEQKTGEPVLGFKDKGKTRFYRVNDPELFAAMSLMRNVTADNMLVNALRYPKRWLTMGATFGPAFKMANFLRDTLHTGMISNDFIPFLDSLRGVGKILFNDKEYVEYLASGHAFAGSYVRADDPKAVSKHLKGVTQKQMRGKVWNVVSSPWRLWEAIGEASENAARVQLYSNLRKKGKTQLEASFAARDIMDFQMSGTSDTLNFFTSVVPFLNARIQGLYKMGRAARENPKVFAGKTLILAAMSLAAWAAYADDDRYKELEDWEKWQYYNFWLGDWHIRIPKPFETGVIGSTLWTATADAAKGNEPWTYVLRTIGHAVMDTFAFNPVPQAAIPIVEQVFNKSMFTGRPIEGQRISKLSPGLRAEPWTSETFKMLGELIGTPPKRTESLVKGYFATYVNLALFFTDPAARWLMDYPERPTKRVDDYPMIGRFLRQADNPRYTKYISKLYDITRQADQLYADVKHLNAIGDYEAARAIKEKHRKKLSMRKRFHKDRRKLTELNRKIRKAWLSETMDGDEKKAKIDKWTGQKNEIVRRVMQMYENKK